MRVFFFKKKNPLSFLNNSIGEKLDYYVLSFITLCKIFGLGFLLRYLLNKLQMRPRSQSPASSKKKKQSLERLPAARIDAPPNSGSANLCKSKEELFPNSNPKITPFENPDYCYKRENQPKLNLEKNRPRQNYPHQAQQLPKIGRESKNSEEKAQGLSRKDPLRKPNFLFGYLKAEKYSFNSQVLLNDYVGKPKRHGAHRQYSQLDASEEQRPLSRPLIPLPKRSYQEQIKNAQILYWKADKEVQIATIRFDKCQQKLEKAVESNAPEKCIEKCQKWLQAAITGLEQTRAHRNMCLKAWNDAKTERNAKI